MAKIKLNNNEYTIPDNTLANATNSFVSHLGTIAGEGMKVVVGGVEYSIDSTKVSGAIAELDGCLDELSKERLEGDGSEFHALAPTSLSFRSTAPLNELQEIQINGVVVDPANYTLEEGSTIVTLPIGYLQTFDAGKHEIAVVSDNKTVKGNFTVKIPQLNEYGFYYSQPYIGTVAESKLALFVHEDNTFDFFQLGMSGETGTCEISEGVIAVNSSLGLLHFSISQDGTELYCTEFEASFALGDESIVADGDYVYTYDATISGYYASAIDRTKASYGRIKVGINGTGITNVGANAFAYCDNLTSISVPYGVVDIGEHAFYYCKSLISIDIPNSVTSIGSYAFCGCTSLVSITIPDSVASIGEWAFINCESLMSINIPDGVNCISEGTFQRCTSLTDVIIPEGMTSIGDSAFAYCQKLTSIIFEGTMAEWDAISKNESWNKYAPATHVQCSDGTVAL